MAPDGAGGWDASLGSPPPDPRNRLPNHATTPADEVSRPLACVPMWVAAVVHDRVKNAIGDRSLDPVAIRLTGVRVVGVVVETCCDATYAAGSGA